MRAVVFAESGKRRQNWISLSFCAHVTTPNEITQKPTVLFATSDPVQWHHNRIIYDFGG